MCISKSAKTVTKHRARQFLTCLAFSPPWPVVTPPHTATVSPTPLFSHPVPSFSHPAFLSSISKLITLPVRGPLFLSPPPWKLSQSATPLHVSVQEGLSALKFLRRKSERLRVNLEILNLQTKYNDRIEIAGSREFYRRFVNLPNMISVSRLFSGPVLGWLIMNEWYLPAFVGLVISGSTDWLDGYVARKMGITSVVGSYLDPLADKVLIGCIALALVEMDLLHPGLVGLIVARDIVLVGGAMYKRASNLGSEWKSWLDLANLDGICPSRVEPLLISKVNTVLQLVLVALALLQPEIGTLETQFYVTYLSYLVALTTLASTVAYGVQHLRVGTL